MLAPPERKELERRVRSRSLAVELVERAKVILLLATGSSYGEIRKRLGCTDRYISVWKRRFKQERLAGLDSRYRGGEYRRRTAQTEARILELTRRGPSDGSTHWSSYRLAKELGVSQSTVSRVWRQFGLQPTVRAATWPAMIQSSKRSRRYHRLVPQTAGACSCILHRREERHPGPRSP